MITVLTSGLVFMLSAVGFLLMIHDRDKHSGQEETVDSQAAGFKSALVYSGIMIVLTIAICVLLTHRNLELNFFSLMKYMMLLCVMWPIAYIDYKSYRIPNSFILFGLICRVILIPFELMFNTQYFRADIVSELVAAGALFVAALLCAICMHGSIGAGDIKMFLIMGLLLGAEMIWIAIFLSLIVAFVMAAYLLATKKKGRKDPIPFGPALVFGTYVSICLLGM